MQEHHTASNPNRILENPERADMHDTETADWSAPDTVGWHETPIGHRYWEGEYWVLSPDDASRIGVATAPVSALTPAQIIALHWICDCGSHAENIEENAAHVVNELAKAGYFIAKVRAGAAMSGAERLTYWLSRITCQFGYHQHCGEDRSDCARLEGRRGRLGAWAAEDEEECPHHQRPSENTQPARPLGRVGVHQLRPR